MNMNIKNEKTMLALIVVAALAMVSVAGVALASESDAATTDLTIVSGGLEIKSSTTDSYGIYNASEGASKVIIAEDAAYSGTLCFGILDNDKLDNGKFTSLVTFTLTDVSNVVFDYEANGKVATVTGNTTGTIAISQGSVILGSTTGYFTGEISGNTATIAAVNVAGPDEDGFTIKAGTTDVLSGALGCGSADDKASIDMTGTANVGTEMTIGVKVTFTVAEDATLNVPANAQTYSIESGNLVVTVMGGVNNLSGYAVGGIYDSDGQEVAKIETAAVNTKTLTFTLSAAMNMSEKYTVQILISNGTVSNGTDVYYYSGSLSFTVAANGTDATTTFTSSTNASKIALADSAVSLSTPILKTLDSEGMVVTYDSADYYVAYTAQQTSGSVAPTNAHVDRANGTITFDATIVGESATTLIVLENKTSGALSYYFGYAKSVTPGDTTYVLQASKGITALGVSTTAADYKILSGGVIDNNPTPAGVSAVTNNGIIDVEGKIFVGYSATAGDMITNGAVITVDGTIEYQVANGTGAPLVATDTNHISAVCYKVAPASTSTQAYTTFYYTTLANAMAAASDMTVYGTITVLEDMTLTGTPVGTETTQNTITVAINSELKVGRVATTGDDAVTAVTAVVTVPKTTQVMINGTVNVANGQYKVEGLFTDSYGSFISANVFMTDDIYGIYTDLATALGLATAEGDVINLRSVATLAADATLVAGVTLNANDNNITIASGTTFTVNGILNAYEIHIQGSYKTSSATVGAGELVLNCYDEGFVISKITTGVTHVDNNGDITTNGGIITLGSEFDTGDYSVAFDIDIGTSTSKIPAVINIDGVVDYSGKITSVSNPDKSYLTLNVTGTLNTVEDAGVDADGIYAVANITGTLYSEVHFGVCEMYVTGTGSVSFDEDNGAYVFVNDKLVSGTAATDVESVTNNTTVKAVINSGIYAVVYGDYTADNISIYKDGGNNSIECSSTVYYVLDKYSATYVFKTLFGADAVNLDLTEPEFESYTFDRWYDNVTGGNDVALEATATIGDHTAVYGYTTIKTFTVSFSYNSDNGAWIVDGNRLGTSGTLTLEIGSHSVSYVANDGYELKDYAIYVNGEAMTDDYEPQNGDVIKFTGTVEQKSTSGGMDLITILLIIITIVIVIMAIIIALKLMRS
jgi:hypothetical protein